MSALIRFEGADQRGPSALLWGGLVDWESSADALGNFAAYVDDFFPYLGDDVGISLSGDSGSAASIQAQDFGVVGFTATQAADAVAGFEVDANVDLDSDDFTVFGMEVRFKVVDDDSTTQTFIGLTDEALDGFFGNDNTPDGSAVGLRWNSDETVDLVSIASNDTITVLIDSIATIERTTGWQKWGFTIENLDGTDYRFKANLERTVSSKYTTSTKTVTSSTVPGASMQPAVIHSNDNQSAPDIDVDWFRIYQKT